MTTLRIQPPQTPTERDIMVRRMTQLRSLRDAGTISNTTFKYEYGAYASALWGSDFFRKARANTTKNNSVSEGEP